MNEKVKGRPSSPELAATVPVGESLVSLQASKPLRDSWANESKVIIWQGDHGGGWWRARGAGYTTNQTEAGVYTFEEAWSHTSHCGPEKKIAFYRLRAVASSSGELQSAPSVPPLGKSVADIDRAAICEIGRMFWGDNKQCYSADAVLRKLRETLPSAASLGAEGTLSDECPKCGKSFEESGGKPTRPPYICQKCYLESPAPPPQPESAQPVEEK